MAPGIWRVGRTALLRLTASDHPYTCPDSKPLVQAPVMPVHVAAAAVL
jgi:hypothetical protein